MTHYIIYAQFDKSQKVIEGAQSIKNARQKAYRAVKRHPTAKYIGIQTIKDYHSMKAANTKVRKGDDGKIYVSVGRKVRELRATGDYVVDIHRMKSEDIFAWYKGETKTRPNIPKSVSKEQPANLMSSKFMRDHIIIARPGPVKDQPTRNPSHTALFTWEQFNKTFTRYYSAMYDGKIRMTREWVEKGDEILQKEKKFINLFVNYRQDVISSDRETAALAMAYEEFKTKKLIK